MEILIIVGGGVVTVLGILAYLYALRYIVQYRSDNTYLRIKLFGVIPVRRIRIQDIVEIQPLSLSPFRRDFRAAPIWAETWPSYIFTRTGVMIRKRSGFSRRLILTPRDPDEFMRALEAQRRSPR